MLNTKTFNRYIGSGLVKKIHSGSLWTEGPCYLKKFNKIIWSDIPNNRILSYDFKKVEIFRSPSNFANGNTLDNEYNLITCEHGTRRITQTNHQNKIIILSNSYENKKLNSPNDICVHSSGTIFFTDPPYGIINTKRVEGIPGKMMYGGCYVFKYDPLSKKTSAIVTNMNRPNGIAFSLNEKKIYISNTGTDKYLRVYDVDKNLNLNNPKKFAQPNNNEAFDGFRIDEYDNVWTSCGNGVKCFSSEGKELGFIDIPEVVSNLEFGGKSGDKLFITATTSLYMIKLNIKGAKFLNN